MWLRVRLLTRSVKDMDFAKLMPPYSPNVWKAIGVSVGLIVVIGAVLLFAQECGANRAARQREALAANVKIAMQELANVKAESNATTQENKIVEAVALEKVKVAANAYVEATNATDAGKTQINAALANLANQVNANRPTNTTQSDIERRLNELEGQ